jgi:beta-glucosidase
MSSYNLINGVHTSESAELCKDILRSEFGFDGVLMTDWIVGGDFTGSASKYPAPGAPRVAAAGHTLFMPGSKKDYDELLQGLKDGIVTTEQLKWNAHWLLQVLSKIGQ